jgi:hypothetical protein
MFHWEDLAGHLDEHLLTGKNELENLIFGAIIHRWNSELNDILFGFLQFRSPIT